MDYRYVEIPPPHLWSPAHLWLKLLPLWGDCEALPTFARKLLPLGGLRAAAIPTWRRAGVLKSGLSGHNSWVSGGFCPPLLLDEIYAPEYSLQNVPSMRSIKCWTDGVRHVPTVLVERVPVSKYVLVLLGF